MSGGVEHMWPKDDLPTVEYSATVPMSVRQTRIPHGAAGTFSGWFTFVRGAVITRRTALKILLFGPRRGRIETVQSNDPEHWRVP
jgi:hypothetical protein